MRSSMVVPERGAPIIKIIPGSWLVMAWLYIHIRL